MFKMLHGYYGGEMFYAYGMVLTHAECENACADDEYCKAASYTELPTGLICRRYSDLDYNSMRKEANSVILTKICAGLSI